MNVKNSDSIESNITDIWCVVFRNDLCRDMGFGFITQNERFDETFHLNFDLILVLIKVFGEKWINFSLS